jgi:UDP-N-acetylglucosamine 2-epimerase (non-hydrolysing)
MKQLTVALILGTRPEAIKMAPLILALRAQHPRIKTHVILSGQHAHLVLPILDFFEIKADITLRLRRKRPTLGSLTSKAVEHLDLTLTQLKPDWVVVQGDTTTAMVGSLAAFYHQIPVAHLEAGLRTNDLYSPFPEEINRRITSQIATLHWPPTAQAAKALQRENLPLAPAQMLVTGNTVIDALHLGLQKLRKNPVADPDFERALQHKNAGLDQLFVLVTGHRREHFGTPLENICRVLLKTAQKNPHALFLYPIHPNPKVSQPVKKILSGQPNFILTKPKNYPEFIQLLNLSDIVVTDSGGVQEEAPALGKTVLVTRESTERPEGLRSGLVHLVGHKPEALAHALHQSLNKLIKLKKVGQKTKSFSPYGDGLAASRCVASLLGKKCHPFQM